MCWCVEEKATDAALNALPPKATLLSPKTISGLKLPVLRRATGEELSTNISSMRLPFIDDARGTTAAAAPRRRSSTTTRRRDATPHWVLRHLAEMGLKPESDSSPPLSLLEVGASKHLRDCSWLDTEAVHPSLLLLHGSVEKVFPSSPPSPPSQGGCYDVIVHNHLEQQHHDWRQALHHCTTMLHDNGHLFLTLPDGHDIHDNIHPALKNAGLRLLYHRANRHTTFLICRRVAEISELDHVNPLAPFFYFPSPPPMTNSNHNLEAAAPVGTVYH